MICYRCDKFIKRGHGKNTYGYRGEYRYYCPLCFKIKNLFDGLSRKKRSYYGILELILLPSLAGFWGVVGIIANHFLNLNILERSYDSSHKYLGAIVLFLPGIIAYLAIGRLIIEPKLTQLREKHGPPLRKEQRLLKGRSEYIRNKYKYSRESFCHCEYCLENLARGLS